MASARFDIPTQAQTPPGKQLRQPPKTGAGLIIVLGALAILNPLSIDMYLPSFPNIQRSFHTSYTQVELSLSGFFIGLIVGQLIYGPMSDKFGRKPPLLFGMGIFCLASIGCAWAPNMPIFIACRVLQAMGGCAGMVTSRAIVRDLFEQQRAAQIFSLLMLVTGLGPILGPSLGGLITSLWGWRTIFYILSATGFVLAVGARWMLPDTRHIPQRHLSVRAVFRAYGSVLCDKHFLGYALTGAIVGSGMFAYITGSPFVFIELFRISPENYGWIFGTNALGLIAVAQINRYMLYTRSIETMLRWATVFSAFFGLMLWLGVCCTDNLLALFLPLFGFLAMIGFVSPNAGAGALTYQRHQAGTAAALQGILQWALAFMASLGVSQLHDGTSRPMAAVICLAGLGACAVFRFFTAAMQADKAASNAKAA